jgi:hypothetical protein
MNYPTRIHYTDVQFVGIARTDHEGLLYNPIAAGRVVGCYEVADGCSNPKRTLTLISLLPGELCCRTALQMISGTG